MNDYPRLTTLTAQSPNLSTVTQQPAYRQSVVSFKIKTCLFCGVPGCDGIGCDPDKVVEMIKKRDEPWNDPARMDAWFRKSLRWPPA